MTLISVCRWPSFSGRTPRAFSLYPAAKLTDFALGCTWAAVAQGNVFHEPPQLVPLHLSPTYTVPVVYATGLAASLQSKWYSPSDKLGKWPKLRKKETWTHYLRA